MSSLSNGFDLLLGELNEVAEEFKKNVQAHAIKHEELLSRLAE